MTPGTSAFRMIALVIRLLVFLLKLAAPRWQLSPYVAQHIERAQRLAKQERHPLSLIPLAARLWSRGWFNRQFFDVNRTWVLPYWATLQLEPTDPGFVSRSLNPALLNQSYRNWTTIGNPWSEWEAIVDPRGLVTPQPNMAGWSLDAWLAVDGALWYPSRLSSTKFTQKLFENLPIIVSEYEPQQLRVSQYAFAAKDEADEDWVVSSYVVENPRGIERSATLYLAVRPFNPEGAAVVDRVTLLKQPSCAELWIDEQVAALLPSTDCVGVGNESTGDTALYLPDRLHQLPGQGASPAGMSNLVAAYPLLLPPHTRRTITAVTPMRPGQPPNDQVKSWTLPDAFTILRRRAADSWRQVLDGGMRIRVPDEQLQDAFDANKAYLLLLHDGNSITPGPFLYHSFWFRDAAFMLNALDQLGYHEQVSRVLREYPRRLRKDGYFLAQEGEADANGQALWSLEQHTRLSGDLELMSEQYWTVLNAAHWIDNERQKTKRAGIRTPTHGLLPPGPSAEHLGPADYYYWDDFWGIAGLRSALFAAKLFGTSTDAQRLQFALDAFASDLELSLKAVQDENCAEWIPASPFRRADSAMVANLIAAYPLRIFAPDDPRIRATLEELKRIAYVDGAFFHHVGHAGFGTYLALHISGCYLFQQKQEAWDGVRFLLGNASPTFAWAEAIHPRTRQGGHGDGHHGWAAAEFVSFVRNSLLYERGDVLVLTPALPLDWTAETLTVRVERAPTFFGIVDYTIAFGERTATLALSGAWREPPRAIEWHLPLEIKTVGGMEPGVELVSPTCVVLPNNATRAVAMW